MADCKPLFPFLQPALNYLRHAYGLCHHPGDFWCLAPVGGDSSKLKLPWGCSLWMLVEICWDLGSVDFSP